MARMSMADLKKLGFHVDENAVARRIVQPKVEAHAVPTQIQISTKAIFIPGNVPSSKNSRSLAIVNGKPKSFESKLCRDYRKQNSGLFMDLHKVFSQRIAGKSKPYRIEFLFARKTKQRFDHHNAVQLLLDMMSEYGWIADDNADEALAIPPMQPYFISKEKPGVYITVL